MWLIYINKAGDDNEDEATRNQDKHYFNNNTV